MLLTDPIEAVSAILTFEEQLFAVERQPYLEEFPGYFVFPNGKIDEKKDDGQSLESSFFPDLNRQHLSVLCRVMNEELGVELRKINDLGIIDSISLIGYAKASIFPPRCHGNWFYRIDLKQKFSFQHDKDEFSKAFWGRPQEFLQTFSSGESLMIPPLRWLLEKLSVDFHRRDIGDLSENFDESNRIPEVVIMDGIRIFPIQSVTLPPAERTNGLILGDEGSPQILVDPSPKSQELYQCLQETLASEKLDAIFLTHHHPDHHQFSTHYARHRRLPILLSEFTNQNIVKKFGNDYFNNLEIKFMDEGDEVTFWHKKSVKVYSVPGHDAGQLALAPASFDWFLVGDLIQGVGTVVISAPEGDMSTYFKTLKRVISFKPKIIIPSHGIPMKGTHRLEDTLKHRYDREKQILNLFRLGNDEQQILRNLYHQVDVRLHPFALKNIQSHLFKLRQEGLI